MKAKNETRTLWLADQVNGTLSLVTVPASVLPRLRRVRALSDGQWFDAYEFIG